MSPTASTPDQILDALDPEQREVASTPTGALCVLAGAGTGKTRAITHRIAFGVASAAYQPSRVLALTFTARAAGEMRTRLRELGVQGVQARTFHAAALRQLHFFWPKVVGGAAPEVLPVKAPLIAEAASRLRLDPDKNLVRDLASEVEWAKVSGITSEAYAEAAPRLGRTPPTDPTTVARFLTAYEDLKTARGVIDFEDVLLLTVGMLAERDDVATAVRAQYRHFVVDEFQDVNAVQQRLLTHWLGDRDEICVVGDPAQTIYSFAGADPAHLREFPSRHPTARTVRLVRNYRSSPQVVHLANAVLSVGTTSGVELRAQAPAGPAPRLTSYPDDDAEAGAVAAQITALVKAGTLPADIAVLFRTNGQSPRIEAALTDAEIPFVLRGGERFFSREEVRRAVVLLRGAARSDDGSTPLGDLTRDVLAGAGWTSVPPSGASARAAWESLSALAALADDVARLNEAARLPDLVRELDERSAAQHAPTVGGVTLSSLHAAKGLEWDVVFLVGCSEGLLPISMATERSAIEEERRLLYVGLTRARRDLRLSWAGARQSGGRSVRASSRFLAPAARLLGVPEVTGPPRASGPRERTRRRAPAVCRTCGAALDAVAERKVGRCGSCPPTYDEATFEALKEWRRTTAGEAKVPAYVVFTDATLTAIAEARPMTEAQLATISGVGARKLAMYGLEVLAVLADHGAQRPAHADAH